VGLLPYYKYIEVSDIAGVLGCQSYQGAGNEEVAS